MATSGPKANSRAPVHDLGRDEDGSLVRGEAENAGGAVGRAARLVVGVDGVPPAGGDDCGHGVLLIVSGGSRSGARPVLAPLCAKGPGSPVGVKRRACPSEEAKPGGQSRAGEATAEPAGQRGGAPQRPLEAERRPVHSPSDQRRSPAMGDVVRVSG